MLEERLKTIIKEVQDFPKPGISFKDITPLLLDPAVSQEILDCLVELYRPLKVEGIAGIESRGFLFGMALALELGVPFIPIRKAGKLPRKTLNAQYALEYGEAQLEVHQEDLSSGQRILIHDDLLATGGTALATAKLLQMAGAEVCGFCFLIGLDFLNGKTQLEPIAPVNSLMHY